MTFTSRHIEHVQQGVATQDGAGVKLTRVLTQNLQMRLDPFLMLDAFGSDQRDDYIAGFPPHPHRGFETVTYMLDGRMRHRDSAGNEGLLGPGGVQWMTAGSGLIHSEMPEQDDGVMEGFQLWVNLPAKSKMVAPSYRDIPSAEIPEQSLPGGGKVRVIAGQREGQAGAVQRPDTEPLYLDLHLAAGTVLHEAIPAGHNAFLYVYRGSVTVGEGEGEEARTLQATQLAILSPGSGREGVTLQATQDAKVLLVAGQPLREAIVQYGPFVMNSQAEIIQAVHDFRAGKMGPVPQ